MPAWLLAMLPEVWKFLKHWGIYILITLVLVGGPYLLYRHGYHVGYRVALKEHPAITVGAGGVVNTGELPYKYIGVKVKCLFLNAGLGY